MSSFAYPSATSNYSNDGNSKKHWRRPVGSQNQICDKRLTVNFVDSAACEEADCRAKSVQRLQGNGRAWFWRRGLWDRRLRETLLSNFHSSFGGSHSYPKIDGSRAKLLPAKSTDAAGRPDAGGRLSSQSLTAWARSGGDSVHPFRESRGSGRRDSNSHNRGSTGGDAVR